MKIKPGDRFKNTKKKTVIEVVEVLRSGKVGVATVTASGTLTNYRTMNGTQLHENPFNLMGQRWQSGYVKIEAPTVPKAPEGEPDLAALDTADLVRWLDQVNLQKAILEKMAKDAKAELRRRNLAEGVSIFGDTAVAYAVPQMFDEEKAQEKLTPQQFQAICVTKPDSTKAQEMLGGRDSDAYRELCSPGTPRITVRKATEEDLENASLRELAA